MTQEVIPELASSTLSSAITTTSQTSIAITARDSFPQSGNFRINIENEIMLVTAGQGTGAGSFTVTRGTDGSTAATHSSGVNVYGVMTANAFYNVLDNAPPINLTSGTWSLQPEKQVDWNWPIKISAGASIQLQGMLTQDPAVGAMGIVAYKFVTSNQGTFTAETTITGLSIWFYVPAVNGPSGGANGRTYRLAARAHAQNDTASDGVRMNLKIDGTQVDFDAVEQGANAANTLGMICDHIIRPYDIVAGWHQATVTMQNLTGGNVTMVASATARANIYLEDLGVGNYAQMF